MNKILSFTLLTFLASSFLQADDDIFDESLEDLMSIETELKADVGSRTGSTDILNSHSPVDVITHQQIEHSGFTSLSDILRYFISGFNAPETSIADGSDHVRTFTLRGMSPDQTLVLLNGKRVHTSSLLNVNATIGRGSSNVDLDTIIPSSIERVEILRDGAAAQYGSDAIAGVINIILKGANHKNSFNIHYGERKKGDGKKSISDIFFTKALKYDGFFNLSLQIKSQEKTDRSGIDQRIEPASHTTDVGLSDATNILATINTEIAQFNNFIFYSNSTFNYRDSQASTFFRPSTNNENTSLLYPEGFLPMLNAEILDYALTTGVNGEFENEIFWDLSNRYGYNQIKYYLNNSMNYSLGADSPTSFYNGSLSFTQNTTNFDMKKNFNALHIATGLEYRYELYTIDQGDEASFINGGSEGFPGYSDKSDINADRDSYAIYFDTTYIFNRNSSLEGAIRYENYSDFGETTNLKIASDYKIIQNLLIRTSISTGFRAPSLAQSNYSNIATFSGISSGTFQPESDIAQEFGAEKLKAETSQHFTLGFVTQITKNSYITLDYFLTDVDNKIMLSDEQTLTSQQQEKYNINKVSYFTNAINTRTYGFDIKMGNKFQFANNNSLDISFWYNYNKNKIIDFNDNNMNRVNSFEQVDRVENGQPKHNIRVLSKYEQNKFIYQLNFNGFSQYAQVIDNKRYWFDKELLTDIDISYKITKKSTFSIGSNNIFNIMPNRWDNLSATPTNPYYGYNGIKPYSRYSPFGYSGAYYYFNINIKF